MAMAATRAVTAAVVVEVLPLMAIVVVRATRIEAGGTNSGDSGDVDGALVGVLRVLPCRQAWWIRRWWQGWQYSAGAARQPASPVTLRLVTLASCDSLIVSMSAGSMKRMLCLVVEDGVALGVMVAMPCSVTVAGGRS